MVKSGNIRLVSELTYLGTRQDRRPRSRAYTCRCTRRAGCSTPRSPRTSPPAQERRTRQYLHREIYMLRKDLSKNIFLNVKIQPGPFSSRFLLLKSFFLQMHRLSTFSCQARILCANKSECKSEYMRTEFFYHPYRGIGWPRNVSRNRRDKKAFFRLNNKTIFLTGFTPCLTFLQVH